MKKLIAMIGAVAMSFGLFADDEPSSLFSISFEASETEKGVDTEAMTFTNKTSSGWTWTPETAFPLSAYAPGEQFAYPESGDKVRRNELFADENNNNYLPLETGTDELIRDVGGNAFLDQLVKFTGFEDPQTNLVAGTKIAIWMSEFENDDESTETNLYVTVGKFDSEGHVEQIALPIAPITGSDGYTLDTWYRLTVKSLGNVYTDDGTGTCAGFLLYINGEKVSTTNDAAKSLIANKDEMDRAAYNCMTNKQLFTAIDATDATFTSVGYKGIGAIDDVILDDVGPAFTVETVDVTFTDVPGAEVFKVEDANGEVGPNQDGSYSVKPGPVTVTMVAAEGYKMKTGAGEYPVTVSGAGEYEITVGEDDFVKVYATKVNAGTTTEYGADELLTMINGLVDGDVVTFNLGSEIYDATEENQLYGIDADTTIAVAVAGGVTTWTITVYHENGAFIDNTGVGANIVKNFTFEDEENGSLTLAGEVAGTVRASLIYEGDVITLIDAGTVITMNGELDVYDSDSNPIVPTEDEEGWFTYALSEPADNLVSVKLGDADPVEYNDVATALAAVADYTKAHPKETVVIEFLQDVEDDNTYAFDEGVTITITTEYEESQAYSCWEITGGNVTFLNGLENNKVVTIVEGDQVEYTLTFSGTMKDGSKITAKRIAVPDSGKIRLSKTATVETATVLTKGEDIDAADEDYEIKVDEDGETYTYVYSAAQSAAKVAEIVGGDQYATLEAAVADLADGQTLKLLSDYTLENAITVNADATIDFGGKTLTATVSNHLTIMAGKTVSITNGTDQFNDVGNYGIEVYGTLNIRAGMNLIVEGKEQPAIDIYNGTVNVDPGVAITSECDIFRFKDCAPNNSYLNIYGGTFTQLPIHSQPQNPQPVYGIIHHYKTFTANVVIVDGTFTSLDPMGVIDCVTAFGGNPSYNCELDDNCKAKFSTNIGHIQNLVVTGCELVSDGTWYTVQKIPTFEVAAISVDNATVVATNTVTEEALALPATVLRDTEIAVTVTPNADYEYKTAPTGWIKNDNGSITTNATVTANLAIEVEAPTKKAADPVDPETPKHYNTPEKAAAAAAEINANKATMIKTPEGAVAADYTALFDAIVTAGNDVVVKLNQAGTNALETAAATIETAVAGKLGNIAAAAAGGNVEVVVTDVEPGFWYGVAATAELTAMGATEPATWQQATTEGVTLTVTKPTTGNAAFFQTRAAVKK